MTSADQNPFMEQLRKLAVDLDQTICRLGHSLDSAKPTAKDSNPVVSLAEVNGQLQRTMTINQVKQTGEAVDAAPLPSLQARWAMEAAGGQTEPEMPTRGSEVRYVLENGPHMGEPRLAFVTNRPTSLVVNLFVLCDTDTDLITPFTHSYFAPRSVTYDPTGKRTGSWHWPERKWA